LDGGKKPRWNDRAAILLNRISHREILSSHILTSSGCAANATRSSDALTPSAAQNFFGSTFLAPAIGQVF
jgi:hypothetical protein